MKKILLITLLVSLVVIQAATSQAADYMPGQKNQRGTVVIEGEAYRNLYVGGGSVLVNQEIGGDLFIGGGSINIAAPVESDLLATGGSINISSSIGGDARVAGGNLNFSAPVTGDVLAAGGTLIFTQNARVGGDLWVAGGSVTLNAPVQGEVKMVGGEMYINSEIGGPLYIRADQSLTFGPQSRVTGPVTYMGRNEAIISPEAQVGTIDFQPIQKRVASGKWTFGTLVGIFFMKFLAALFAGLVLLKLFGARLKTIVNRTEDHFWSNLGIGTIALIGVPVLFVLLMITVLGSLLGFMLILSFLLALVVNWMLTIFFLGGIAEKWARKEDSIAVSWKTLLYGILIEIGLSLIPVIGWITIFIIYVTNFGSSLRVIYSFRSKTY